MLKLQLILTAKEMIKKKKSSLNESKAIPKTSEDRNVHLTCRHYCIFVLYCIISKSFLCFSYWVHPLCPRIYNMTLTEKIHLTHFPIV